MPTHRLLTSTLVPTLLAMTTHAGDAAQELPVTAVTLYASGVGAFEHRGSVTDQATVALRLRADQVNDLLKSLVVEDTAGTPGAVAYPSQDPVERTLRTFRIDLSGNPTLAQLVTQLRGAEVQVAHLDRTLTGTVVGAERKTRQLAETQTTVESWVMTVLSDGALVSLPLDEVKSLKPTDAALREDLTRALAALAMTRDREQKTLLATFAGKGAREARMQYVVEAPVWKASYRLILPDAAKADAPARIQGWAMVENTTQSDWRQVHLTLVSGRPVSFRMNLYQPLYAERPWVAAELPPGVNPVALEGGSRPHSEAAAAPEQAQGRAARSNRLQMPKAPAAAMEANDEEFVGALRSADGARMSADYAGSVKAMTQATQEVGELFEYRIGQTSIARGQAAMLPILAADQPVERVAIYDASVHAVHPLAGVRFTLAGTAHLSPGPVAVYDGASFAGDARLVATAPGQSRLLGYALDQRLRVDVQSDGSHDQRRVLKIVKGVMEVRYESRQERRYAIANQSDKAKTVIVQHPRAHGHELIEPTKAEETTPSHHRLRIAAPAGTTTTLVVAERQVVNQQIGLIDQSDPSELQLWLNVPELPAKARAALEALLAIARERHAHLQEVQAANTRAEVAARDQARTRDNLRSAASGSDLHKRFSERLGQLETQIDDARIAATAAQAKADEAQRRLAAAIQALSID